MLETLIHHNYIPTNNSFAFFFHVISTKDFASEPSIIDKTSSKFISKGKQWCRLKKNTKPRAKVEISTAYTAIPFPTYFPFQAVYENFELTVYPVNEVRNCIVYEKSSETWHREFCGVSKPSICQNSNSKFWMLVVVTG